MVFLIVEKVSFQVMCNALLGDFFDGLIDISSYYKLSANVQLVFSVGKLH